MAAQTKRSRNGTWRLASIGIAAALVALVHATGEARAAEITTGSDDVQLRLDNTLRYNLAYRTDPQDKAIIANPNVDDGDRNFGKGFVSNRLDLLSELDLTYRGSWGFRVSGAGWFDERYQSGFGGNGSVATSNHLVSGQPSVGLSPAAQRFGGPYGELLDAFAFGQFSVAGVPTYLKVGRHTLYWGESLLLGGATHGISYAQMPLDLAKGYAVPGTEAKELFRPLLSVSAQSQLTSTLSLAAQYFLQWEGFRLPEPGSYLSFNDAVVGGESLIAGPTRLRHGHDVHPDGTKDWGVSARWTPDWLEGTLGVYYRRFSDKLPQTHLQPSSGQYFFAYGDSIDLVGVSVSKQILNVSVAAELSARWNMPLLSDPAVVPAGGALPAPGETLGARGNTYHGVLNFLGMLTRTPLWDAGSWSAEVTWNRWDHVSQGLALFKGRDGYTAIDRVTRDFVGVAGGFTPTWFQVLSGVDVSLPVTYGRGLYGNSAVLTGGNKNAGTYSVGVSADVRSRYRVDLRYADYFGDYSTSPTGAMTVANGVPALLKDRGTVSLMVKTTF